MSYLHATPQHVSAIPASQQPTYESTNPLINQPTSHPSNSCDDSSTKQPVNQQTSLLLTITTHGRLPFSSSTPPFHIIDAQEHSAIHRHLPIPRHHRPSQALLSVWVRYSSLLSFLRPGTTSLSPDSSSRYGSSACSSRSSLSENHEVMGIALRRCSLH
jgi:hypothetical protein